MANQDTDLRCYLTNAGIAAENNSIQLGRKLPVKEMVFGSGLLADESDPRLQTTMIQEEYTVPCGMLFDPESPTLLVFKGDLPADVGGFHINEVAIRLEDGTLYGYARGKGDYKPTIEQGATDSVRYAVEMYTTNASNVECKIDLSKVYVDWEDLEVRIKAHTDDNDPHPQYLTKEQFNNEIPALKQPWSELVNYSIGEEVVRNGLRYIARAASGPDNGGAATPGGTEQTWDPALPQSYTIRKPSSWVKIAVIRGGTATDGDAVFISVFGGSNYALPQRFSADILLGERGDSVSVVIVPKTLAVNNPTFYTKRIAAFTYELWFKRETSFPSVLTVVQNSRPLISSTEVGILETSSTEPAGATFVPYDTGYQFASIPIGMEVAFDTPPPTDDPRFRFVKLTADDAYNSDLLNNKVISGTAPNLVVKMTVSSSLSPISGQQIFMLNTMGAMPTPGLTYGVIIPDAMRNFTGEFLGSDKSNPSGATGVFSSSSQVSVQAGETFAQEAKKNRIDFDLSSVVPTADRVQVFGVIEPLYKRIY